MDALKDLSRKAIICLTCSTAIMLTFFVFKTLVVFRFIHHSTFTHYFEWLSVIAFMPPFFMVVKEFLAKKAFAQSDAHKKNVFLEHSAKIIRHDMHSGINTYLPRGIKSLRRRLSDEVIKDLKIEAPLKLIEDGLAHAQKVYAGVFEFTNLVKEGATLSTKPTDIKSALEDYLKLTTYKSQVLIQDTLPTALEVNEALFCTAIDNFIRNGLKYNDSSKKLVTIGTCMRSDTDKKGNTTIISYIYVEDNGRGMTGEEFIQLSKPYTRREGQKESGTGLGLNIAVEILQNHGFEIHADKKEEGGTKLYIKI